MITLASTPEPLTLEQIYALDEHPMQRDTIKHGKAAQKKHLKISSPLHGIIATCVYEGKQYLVDGHTRRSLWKAGKLDPPSVFGHVKWLVDNQLDFQQVYSSYDNAAAVEKKTDILDTAIRTYAKSVYAHPLFSSGMSTIRDECVQIKIPGLSKDDPAYQSKTVQALSTAMQAIVEQNFDIAINVTANIKPTLVYTFLRDNHNVCVEFWRNFFANTGKKIGSKYDIVELCHMEIKLLNAATNKRQLAKASSILLFAYREYQKNPTKEYTEFPVKECEEANLKINKKLVAA